VVKNPISDLGKTVPGNLVPARSETVDDYARREERIPWLASFPEMNPNPVIEMDAQGEITFANEASHKILKLLGLPENPALFIPDDKEEILRLLREGLEHQIVREITLETASFSENIILVRELQVVRIYAVDITERKMAEEKLRRSYELTSMILGSISGSFIALDKNWQFTYINQQAVIPNIPPADVIGKSIWEVFPEIIGTPLETLYREVMANRKPRTYENKSNVALGRYFELYVYPIGDSSIAIFGQDITERKEAEVALRHNQENLVRAQVLLEAVTKATDVIIAVQDTDLRYIFFNQTYKEEIKRLTGKDLAIGTSMVELFAEKPEEQKMSIEEWSKVLKGENVNQIIEFRHPGKHRRIYRVLHTPIRDAHGTIVGAGEVAYDVTKHVQVEDKLRETKEYLDNLITYANAPIIVWDPQFRITLFNRAFEHLTGRKAKEVIGKHMDILIPENCLTMAMDLIRKTMEGQRWDSVEMPILHKQGKIRTVLWNSAAIFGADGKTIVSTIAQGQDITDRKKIESDYRLRAAEYAKMNEVLEEEIWHRKVSDTTLKKTLSLLNASLESTADGILVIDQQDRITGYNQNFMDMWSIPRGLLESGENEAVMKHVLPQLKNPEDFLASIQELHAHPARESFDMIEFNDERIFERYSKPQKIGDSIVGRVWSYRDVTDRKHAEEKLIASVQEKEVLLREIHHRVKNNLQLVTGLLDMTRMRTEDESTNSILTDLMLKIQTMAQIHTRLYESKQFGRINITGQIRDQVTALSNIYSHKGHEISCEIPSQEVILPVDQALPCALVVNEILSNAYKHAFKGRKKGKIEISAVQENGQIRITVRDNGIGIPVDFDISRSNSLGLKLIRTLVQHQLKGSLMVKSQNGTEISMEFPVIIAGT
jgi:PAS domain S-box-containing protein